METEVCVVRGATGDHTCILPADQQRSCPFLRAIPCVAGVIGAVMPKVPLSLARTCLLHLRTQLLLQRPQMRQEGGSLHSPSQRGPVTCTWALQGGPWLRQWLRQWLIPPVDGPRGSLG